MPPRKETIRNIPNLHLSLHQGTGVKLAFANAIVTGNLDTVQNTRIAKTWFTDAWDNHGNKLLAFAAKIALQHSPVQTPSGLSPHAKIFQHLASVCVGYGEPVFTTAKNLKNYSVLHVIGNHNKSKGQDASHLLAILQRVAPGEALKKAFGKMYEGKHLPHTLALQRGNANLYNVLKKHAKKTKNASRGANSSNNNNNVRMRTAQPAQVNQATMNALVKRLMQTHMQTALDEEKKKLQTEIQAEMKTYMGQLRQQAEAVATRAFNKTAEKELGVGRRKKTKRPGNPYGFRTTPGRMV